MPRKALLPLMCCVVAMTVIDLSVVNVALPSIQADLGARPADLQWVVVLYSVVVAGFLMLGGRAGDLVGHRSVLVTGLLVLAVASLFAGLSGSLGLLLAGRAGQGLGAAMAMPNALAILSHAFAEGPERNRALGIFGAAGAAAAVLGSVLGGVLVEGPGWQWAFFINVPCGFLLSALVLIAVAPERPRPRLERFDLAGAAALTGGLMALVIGLHESIAGWLSATTLAPLALGCGLLAAFARIEESAAAPLIPLVVLRRRSLAGANLCAGLLWACFLGLTYELTLYLQQVLEYPPLAAGSSTLPIAVVAILVSGRCASPLIGRVGAATTIAVGMASLGAGLLLLLRAGSDASYLGDLLPPFLLVGAGIGLGQVAVQIAAFAGVGSSEAGLAGGAVETSTEIGGALGLATGVAVALGGAAGPTAAFHRSVLVAVTFAAAGLVVAIALLRPTEEGRTPTDPLLADGPTATGTSSESPRSTP